MELLENIKMELLNGAAFAIKRGCQNELLLKFGLVGWGPCAGQALQLPLSIQRDGRETVLLLPPQQAVGSICGRVFFPTPPPKEMGQLPTYSFIPVAPIFFWRTRSISNVLEHVQLWHNVPSGGVWVIPQCFIFQSHVLASHLVAQSRKSS